MSAGFVGLIDAGGGPVHTGGVARIGAGVAGVGIVGGGTAVGAELV